MYDPNDHKTIQKLLDLFGKEECLRCGFLGRDDNATLFLAIIGTGYLLDILAAEVDALHEAYAAGYRQGYQQAKDGF